MAVSPSTSGALPRGHERILVVEDAQRVRSLVGTVLESLGYQVTVMASGQEALGMALPSSGPFALLLTDVVMPEVGGRAVAETLTRQWPELRVLYMSGFAADVNITQRALAGDLPFLPKPFTPLALARKVRAVLDAPPTHRRPDPALGAVNYQPGEQDART
jgi:two-component system, cell cycle sensor histidine kinase and response regulator CckA